MCASRRAAAKLFSCLPDAPRLGITRLGYTKVRLAKPGGFGVLWSHWSPRDSSHLSDVHRRAPRKRRVKHAGEKRIIRREKKRVAAIGPVVFAVAVGAAGHARC
eukprot:782385-Prorocentrum_minimum.AAC.2